MTHVAVVAISLVGFSHCEWQACGAFQIYNDLINFLLSLNKRMFPFIALRLSTVCPFALVLESTGLHYAEGTSRVLGLCGGRHIRDNEKELFATIV